MRGELERQQGTLEMIASENFVPRAAPTPGFDERVAELTERVRAIVERYPLYEELATGAPA